MDCGGTGPSDLRSTATIRSRSRSPEQRGSAAGLRGTRRSFADRRFQARFAAWDVREAPGENGELTRAVQNSRAGLVRAGDEEQRVIDGELWRVGVLVVGGEVGDFGEQQGDKGSLLAALDRSEKSWFALASTISGLRRRCSSAVAKTTNLVGFLG